MDRHENKRPSGSGRREKNGPSEPSVDEYEEPAEWTKVPDGTVNSIKRSYEHHSLPSGTRIKESRQIRITTAISNSRPTRSPVATVIHGNIVGNVVSIGGNIVCNSDQTTSCDTVTLRTARTEGPGDAPEAFIEGVHNALRKNMVYDVRANFREYLQPVTEDYNPTYVLSSFGCRSGECVTATGTGGEVTLEKIHESLNDPSERHALLLGGPGDGKTVTAKRYAKLVYEKKVPQLKNVEMVHYITGSGLDVDSECTPFDLLFTNQLSRTVTDSKIIEAGEEWIRENPEKVLIVLDALDKVNQGGPGGNIALKTKAKPFTTILNLFRGNIYRGIWILSTSRWNWIWKLPRKVLPLRGIELRGFSCSTARLLLTDLIGKEKRRPMVNIIARYPRILELCQTPMFLLYLAKILSQMPPGLGHECTLSQQAILMKLLGHLRTSAHAFPQGASVVHCAMSLGYQSTKNNTTTLCHVQVGDKTNVAELEQIVTAKPDPDHFEGADEFLPYGQMCYTFRSEILRDMLAALHIIIQNKSQFKDIVNAELNANTSTNVQTLVFGTVMDDKLAKSVIAFTENDVSFAEKRKVLKKILINRLTSTLSDIQILHLLYECKTGNTVTQINAPTEIWLQNATSPCDGHAALSVACHFQQIKRFRANDISLDATSLPLLFKQHAVDVGCLTISGEPMPNDLDYLWKFLEGNSKPRKCRLIDYTVVYSAESHKVHVDVLKSDDAELVAAFLRNAPTKTTVVVNSYHVNGKNRSYIAELKELEVLAKRYDFKVKVLNVQGDARGMAKVLHNMMIGKPQSLVDKLEIQGTFVAVKKDTTLNHFIIDGHLTDSEMVIKIIEEGRWHYIESKNFLIKLPEENCKIQMQVVEEFETQQTSYVALCKFMIKLRCARLICFDVDLRAEYDFSKGSYKLNLGVKLTSKLYGDRQKGFCQFLLTSNARAVKFMDLEFVSESDENSVRLKIGQMDGEQLSSLNYLLSLSEIAVISVDECILNDPENELRDLSELAMRTKFLISTLKVTGDMGMYTILVYSLRLKVFYNKATIGIGEHAVNIRRPSPEQGEVTISKITTEGLIAILNDWLELIDPDTVICILQLEVPSVSDLRTMHEVWQEASYREVAMKVNQLNIDMKFVEVVSDIMKLSAVMHVGKVSTTDAEFHVDYSDYIKIRAVSLEEINLEDLDISFWHDQGIEKMLVKNCTMHSIHNVERLLESFANFLRRQEPLRCKVETLHVSINLREVTPRIRDIMMRGNLSKVVSHGEVEISLWRDQRRQIFSLSILKADAADLEKLVDDIGLKPDEVLLEECDVGARGHAALIGMISTAQNIPEDMLQQVLEFTSSVAQTKVDEHFLLLDRFASQNRQLQVNNLNINGLIGRFDYLIDLMNMLSICSITSHNGSIQYNTDCVGERIIHLSSITLYETATLALLINGGDCKVQVERLDLEDLATSDNRENFDAVRDLFRDGNMAVKIVESSSDLDTIADELAYILQHLKPRTIITTAYNIEIEYPSPGKIWFYAKQRPNCSNVSDEALARFAKRAGAEYSVRETRSDDDTDTRETTPKQLQAENSISDNTTPKEVAYSEYEIQESLQGGDDEGGYEYVGEVASCDSLAASDEDRQYDTYSMDDFDGEHLYEEWPN